MKTKYTVRSDGFQYNLSREMVDASVIAMYSNPGLNVVINYMHTHLQHVWNNNKFYMNLIKPKNASL